MPADIVDRSTRAKQRYYYFVSGLIVVPVLFDIEISSLQILSVEIPEIAAFFVVLTTWFHSSLSTYLALEDDIGIFSSHRSKSIITHKITQSANAVGRVLDFFVRSYEGAVEKGTVTLESHRNPILNSYLEAAESISFDDIYPSDHVLNRDFVSYNAISNQELRSLFVSIIIKNPDETVRILKKHGKKSISDTQEMLKYFSFEAVEGAKLDRFTRIRCFWEVLSYFLAFFLASACLGLSLFEYYW